MLGSSIRCRSLLQAAAQVMTHWPLPYPHCCFAGVPITLLVVIGSVLLASLITTGVSGDERP